MDSHLTYQTLGSSALNPSSDKQSSSTPIIDFYHYANTVSRTDGAGKRNVVSLKHKLCTYLKHDVLFQDFWLPKRPETKLGNDTILVFVTSAALFVPIAIGILAFF